MTDLRQAAQQALKALEVLSKLGNGGTDGNSVGNTIAQEAREHLFTALAQPEQQAEPTPWRDMVVVSLVREGIDKHKARELADHFAAQQQAEPVTRKGFNDWWDSEYDDSENRFEKDSAAYWAWAGWESAQRPWVGLTDDDFLEACQIAEHGNYLVAFQRIQIKLQERNT